LVIPALNNASFPKAGIYFLILSIEEEVYVSSLYVDYEKKIDKKYLPDSIATTDDVIASIASAADKISTIYLPEYGWIEGTNGYYRQTVQVSGATVNSKVDIYPTPEQLVELQSAGIALVAVNENGVVTVYALNNKPTSDYSMQVILTEVNQEV
jgi:hypothetical protein